MKHLVFIGAHLGYPMERTPLGGGAMVGLQLSRAWAASPDVRLTVLGSGPESPTDGAEYARLAAPGPEGLVSLSELKYAAFCRRFEAETTAWLLSAKPRLPPGQTGVVVNDISEGPNLEALSKAGYRPVSIWHVDVADYFNRMYLGNRLKTPRVTGAYEWLCRLGLGRALPRVLRLVFEKQRRTVIYSSRLVFPSSAMAQVVRRSYPAVFASDEEFNRRALVLPWGAWSKALEPEEARAAREKIRRRCGLGPQAQALMTLSRISPEKGLHLLFEALRLLERRGFLAGGRELGVFVCGAPAFMRGESYSARVRRAAGGLESVRVIFPGYLDETGKREFFASADLFVSASVHESYGLTLLEAMRSGLPVLSLDHYGARDWPADSGARLVSAADRRSLPGALAEALGDLLSDPKGLSDQGKRAAAFAASQPFSRAAEAVLHAALEAAEPAANSDQRR